MTKPGASRHRRLGAVAVSELSCSDFLERDLQVVLRTRLDHRRGVLVERPLAEVVVVRVELARALGGHEHDGVMRVDSLEKCVQSGLDHELVMVATSLLRSSTAASRSSFTTTWSNSPSAASSSCATFKRGSICSGASEPRPTSRVRSASSDGGAMNTLVAPGTRSRT